MTDRQLVVYSDYVCPFCYLGRVALERYEDDRGSSVELEWRPFDLRGHKRTPDGEIRTDVEDGKDDDYYEQAEANVRKLQERYGAEMAQTLRRDVDSWPTQQASLYVRETTPETWREFDEALFDALWRDGRDIGDPDVIADVADGVGLDADAVRSAATDDGEWDDRLRAAFDDAREFGVSGVPTWIYDDHAARGAVPPEHLERLIEGADASA
ncbi:Predicted dithiol-disulfide isomerase, DsbA family [Halopenitus malekzadehii]|uniref:Predicted dithiol-disulfide isomerase, DsbA family n=1 Tax=Halopenitus malekzadehii TaxID=1267564 RepID=A0A1H6J832_9EURY|nr:DsbA family protein [Halopenitus malekzadehii]SEH56861.1 Predicted dithiol-disulfide isomerase, DsbA family [Halopenitus malekzadehii]